MPSDTELEFDITPYKDSFVKYGKENNIPPEYLAAMAIIESSLRPKAVSRSGARGLLQLIPDTFRSVHPEGDPFNPDDSIYAGSRYLRKMLDRFEDDMETALAAYNAGPTRVSRIRRRHGPRWREHLPSETRNYITIVPKTAEKYRHLFEEPLSLSSPKPESTGSLLPSGEERNNMEEDRNKGTLSKYMDKFLRMFREYTEREE